MILLLFLLGLLLYFVIRHFSVLRQIYRLYRLQKDFSSQHSQRTGGRGTPPPPQGGQRTEEEDEVTSVEKLQDAQLDLSGGEYIDYEEVKE